jgi:hypothetical protein
MDELVSQVRPVVGDRKARVVAEALQRVTSWPRSRQTSKSVL